LTTNKDNSSFKQCIALQFKANIPKNKLNINQDLTKSSKQVNVSIISLFISPRPSKKVLEKLKFYKTKITYPFYFFSKWLLIYSSIQEQYQEYYKNQRKLPEFFCQKD